MPIWKDTAFGLDDWKIDKEIEEIDAKKWNIEAYQETKRYRREVADGIRETVQETLEREAKEKAHKATSEDLENMIEDGLFELGYRDGWDNYDEEIDENYHEETVTIGLRIGQEKPEIIIINENKPFNQSEFVFLSSYQFTVLVANDDETDIVPLSTDPFKVFTQEYEAYVESQKRKEMQRSLVQEEYDEALRFTVRASDESEEYLKLLEQYLRLTQEDKFELGACRVVQRYLGSNEKPELVEQNKFTRNEVQYWGNYTYSCVLNKYTKEVIMVDPSKDPFGDFEQILYRLKFENSNNFINPKKTFDDMRTRRDVSINSFTLNYSDFKSNPAENVRELPIPEDDGAFEEYLMRHIYFNEKYFLTDGENVPRTKYLAEVLMSRDTASRKSYDFLYRMYLKSEPHKYHPFGQKYFGLKLSNFEHNQEIEYNTDIQDINIIKKADKVSNLSYIMYNDGEEKPPLKRFKKRTQLITQRISGSYLREVTFESTIDIIEKLYEIIGIKPTVSFKTSKTRTGELEKPIYHYSWVLDGNFINDEILEAADKILERVVSELMKTYKSLHVGERRQNIWFKTGGLYYNNFEKPWYENYQLTDSKLNFNELKKRV